jgi:hypothetical protein
MDDDLRNQLEAVTGKRAERKRNWNISQEILLRLRCSLDKERENRRSAAMRALCYVISELGRREFFTDFADRRSWHREPFTFRAFKLAVTRLLDELEPPGEIRPSSDSYVGQFETPEELAAVAADHMLYRLRHDRPLTQEQKAELLGGAAPADPLIEHLPEFERELYAMASARHHLGLDEPGESKS